MVNSKELREVSSPTFKVLSNPLVRWIVVALGITTCVWCIRASLSYAASHVLTTYALANGDVDAAKKAVEFAPHNADAHLAEAVVLSMSGAVEQSPAAFERAVALRPAHYALWLQLGLVRDQLGDTTGALSAFNAALTRAPYYSQPRWSRGNVLLRNRDYEAAFSDLNAAADSNPELVPALVDLAWGLSRGDVGLAQQLVPARNPAINAAYAKILAKTGRNNDALAQFGGAENIPDEKKQDLLNQLLASGGYKEAFEIWRSMPGNSGSNTPSVIDGSFEGRLTIGEKSFGWRVPKDLQSTEVSLDTAQPQNGAKSLRIEFSGDSNPGAMPVSQLVVIEPKHRYRLSFASRTQNIVTGGLPLVAITDASDNKRLAESAPLGKEEGWQTSSIEFTTGEKTTAIVFSLQRQNCSTSPCPIFGSIFLDSFSLERLD